MSYNKQKNATFNFHKRMDVSHLKRMPPHKIRFVYSYTVASSKKHKIEDIPPFQMLLFLIKNYDYYCKTIKKAIKESYQYKNKLDVIESYILEKKF